MEEAGKEEEDRRHAAAKKTAQDAKKTSSCRRCAGMRQGADVAGHVAISGGERMPLPFH